ncbi:MAG: hypothetical protein L6R39_004270 [Caloplaca ligustica]|nr:MAG: hypothetical protein L6R39_004270 [Caloplaca ligustica]
MLLSLLLPTLALLIAHFSHPTVGDTFRRMTCWCRNETEIGWLNRYKYHNTGLNRDFVIQEKCLDYFDHGECLHYHERQSMICQDYSSETVIPTTSMNTFCYNNRGHEFTTKKGAEDVIHFNKHKRTLEKLQRTANATREVIDEACGRICDAEFALPIMLPWDPGHGNIESRAEEWDGFWNLDVCDGCQQYEDNVTGLGTGIANDKGGPDHDLTGHYSPKGYYDTTGYDAKGLLDRLPHLK